jgi:hypothetical protein
VRREDVQAFVNRPWEEVRASKEAFWVAQRERISLTEAFEMADALRASAVELAGTAFLTDRDEDLKDLIALKTKLQKAHAAKRD